MIETRESAATLFWFDFLRHTLWRSVFKLERFGLSIFYDLLPLLFLECCLALAQLCLVALVRHIFEQFVNTCSLLG